MSERFVYNPTAPSVYCVDTFPAPMPGTAWFVSVPSSELWRVVCVHFRLQTAPGGPWRRPRLEFDSCEGGRTFAQVTSWLVDGAKAVDGWFAVGSMNPTGTIPFIGTLLGETQLCELWATGGDMHLQVEGMQPTDQLTVLDLAYFKQTA